MPAVSQQAEVLEAGAGVAAAAAALCQRMTTTTLQMKEQRQLQLPLRSSRTSKQVQNSSRLQDTLMFCQHHPNSHVQPKQKALNSNSSSMVAA
jgi:hypothetical protein